MAIERPLINGGLNGKNKIYGIRSIAMLPESKLCQTHPELGSLKQDHCHQSWPLPGLRYDGQHHQDLLGWWKWEFQLPGIQRLLQWKANHALLLWWRAYGFAGRWDCRPDHLVVTWNLWIDRREVYVIVSNLHMFGDVLSDPFSVVDFSGLITSCCELLPAWCIQHFWTLINYGSCR